MKNINTLGTIVNLNDKISNDCKNRDLHNLVFTASRNSNSYKEQIKEIKKYLSKTYFKVVNIVIFDMDSNNKLVPLSEDSEYLPNTTYYYILTQYDLAKNGLEISTTKEQITKLIAEDLNKINNMEDLSFKDKSTLYLIGKLTNNSIVQILSKIQVDKNYRQTETRVFIEGKKLVIPHILTSEIQKLHKTQTGQTLV